MVFSLCLKKILFICCVWEGGAPHVCHSMCWGQRTPCHLSQPLYWLSPFVGPCLALSITSLPFFIRHNGQSSSFHCGFLSPLSFLLLIPNTCFPWLMYHHTKYPLHIYLLTGRSMFLESQWTQYSLKGLKCGVESEWVVLSSSLSHLLHHLTPTTPAYTFLTSFPQFKHK